MTALAALPLSIPHSSAAARLARQRWAGNCAALAKHQSEVSEVAGNFPADVEWVVARDNSLTCLDTHGSWWADCSVPRLAAMKLLKSLECSVMVSAYLSPAYAELLHAARLRMGAGPALVAIVPTTETLRILLACGDFTAEIESHRLWFVVGENWPEKLRQLFEKHPGLPPPGRFIRTKLTDSAVTAPMIMAAQAALAEIATSRSVALSQVQQFKPRESARLDRLLVIAPSRYRLWDDAAPALDEAARHFGQLVGGHVQRFDTDDPLNASTLALATSAAESDAVLTADKFRADAAGLVAPMTPWLTWAARGPIAPFDPAAPRDRVIAATEALARVATQAGWPASAVLLASSIVRPIPLSTPARPHLAIVADLADIEMPKSVEDLSSHRLLWEFIDAEIKENPFLVRDHPTEYLFARAGELGIPVDELDVHAFVDGLILPRWQRALARLTVAANFPLQIYGRGWSEEPAVAVACAGELCDRANFERATGGATALIHVWPGVADHPVHRVGLPVVRATESWSKFLETSRRLLDRSFSATPKNVRTASIPLLKLLASLA